MKSLKLRREGGWKEEREYIVEGERERGRETGGKRVVEGGREGEGRQMEQSVMERLLAVPIHGAKSGCLVRLCIDTQAHRIVIRRSLYHTPLPGMALIPPDHPTENHSHC